MDENNKTFCVFPWVNLSTVPTGNLRLCCFNDTLIKKNNGSYFNLGKDSVQDIINSNHYKDIRKRMINGEPVKGCNSCYDSEAKTGHSYRLTYNKMWVDNPSFQKKYKQSVANTDIDPNVQYLDLRFGNLCNLACRSCNGFSSSTLNEELIELKDTNIVKFQRHIKLDFNSWYENSMLMENIDFNQLEELYVTGGEPTLVKKTHEIITKLIETGDSKHVNLRFNSNLTNTKYQFYDLLEHFKNVTITCSIDGYKNMQEYLRYPSNWDQISKNLMKITNIKSAHILVSPVVQKTNLGYLVELFEFIENINRDLNGPIIELSPIITHEPKYLDIEFLPTDYKMLCWEKIEVWMKSCKFQGDDFYGAMRLVKEKCLTQVEYETNLADYFEYNDILDKNRNENLSDINPELASFRR